ncbi:uncharacterized protein VTP21DRAFT_855 [Calcarisporiella thermophila]|uniref:uncharacterized protein n=1 Tax=Calcarisporiella thermophila TaxID=911321 RepID=UPI003743B5E6
MRILTIAILLLVNLDIAIPLPMSAPSFPCSISGLWWFPGIQVPPLIGLRQGENAHTQLNADNVAIRAMVIKPASTRIHPP